MPAEKEINQLIDHLFRHESGKTVAVLTKVFGADNMDLAEDVVQDALMEALTHWSYRGIPDNPSAWLFRVAKNKALNIINHEKYKRKYSSDMLHYLKQEETAEPSSKPLFSEQEMIDDQLRMMFTCCYPSISAESQTALILKTLCGFSIPEIAKAFLTSEETINKRLVRARQKIREENVAFEMPQGAALKDRLQVVLDSIYLLFNEGYNASSGDQLIRYELCEEAIRLTEIITTHPAIEDKDDVFALLALMQLNASRFASRQDKHGNILTLAEQDRSLWNQELMNRGFANLEKSVSKNLLSSFHILASISAYHCAAPGFEATDWNSILELYDKLLQIDASPVVYLNRAIAVSKAQSIEKALEELEQIKDYPSLRSYYLFYSTRAALFFELKQLTKAAENYREAIRLSSLQAEKDLLQRKLDKCINKQG